MRLRSLSFTALLLLSLTMGCDSNPDGPRGPESSGPAVDSANNPLPKSGKKGEPVPKIDPIPTRQ